MKNILLFSFFFALWAPLAGAKNVRKDLARLYPEQSADMIEARIETLENPGDFFKAFNPYFQYRLVQDLFQKAPWSQLRSQVGWCLGDPHPENFGTLLSEKGKAYYGPNDFDDAHPCPQSADVLRLLTGWHLWVGEGATEELLATYLKARKTGLVPPPPPTIARLLVESEFRGTRPSLKWYQPELNILRRRADLRSVPSPFDREVAQLALKVLEGKGEVVQVAERVRVSGGSGGVKRFMALLNTAKGPLLLEMKEIVRPATFPWGIPLLDPFVRMKTAWEWEQKPTLSPLYGLGSLFSRPFSTRPVWEGHLTFELKELSGLQKRDVAHFQAALLGALHRNSPTRIGTGNMELIGPAVWAKAVRDLSKEMVKAYDEVRGPIEARRAYRGRSAAQ